VPDESRKPVRGQRPKPTVGGVLLWGFVAAALAYAVFLIVLGLTR
jgi:hypothetical protein